MDQELKLERFTEFETKYKIDGSKLFEFKAIADKLEGLESFIYVEGPDTYWTKGEDFFRYRKATHDITGKAWLTMKKKPEGASNNKKRKETNWRVDETPFAEIEEGIKLLGFEYNFKIYKICHIYKFQDATLVFYTVKDEKEDMTHFIEIEVDEHTISNLTEEQADGVIKKYETVLAPMGITYRNRIKRSLFEMYRKENKVL